MRNSKKPFCLPFKGKWLVAWGGNTKELNQHHDNLAQKYAFDFVIVNEYGKTYKNSSAKNENYFCFAKEIICPANGVVVQVVEGVDDNKPGYLNGYWAPGNTVIIQHSKKLYSVLAHLKQDTIRVKVGDKLKQGDVLGLCGNSGMSSEPHLHFHLQDEANILFAKGIKCFFSKGQQIYSPIKGDIVSQ